MADPLIVDLKRNSLDDGPGIRTVVFFKGCPLRCSWCQNPEAVSPKIQMGRDIEPCLGCRRCTESCSDRIARPSPEPEPSERCRHCGCCVEACPLGARRLWGTSWRVEELARELLRDEPFFRRSGGGITLSGGEPASFARFAGELASELRSGGAHVLLETSGYFRWQPFAEYLLPHLSTIYFDLKLADEQEHRYHTGRSNRLILDNLRRLRRSPDVELLARVPLVPGITDTARNLTAIAQSLRVLEIHRVALLAYNPTWLAKRRSLGLPSWYAHADWMAATDIARCREIMAQAGLEVG
jgi:pyruvate formate lyase activating enzyme